MLFMALVGVTSRRLGENPIGNSMSRTVSRCLGLLRLDMLSLDSLVKGIWFLERLFRG